MTVIHPASVLHPESDTIRNVHTLGLPAYRIVLRDLPHSTPCGSHELAALGILMNATRIYDSLARKAARHTYTANRSYASTCFSATVDKARRVYDAG